MKLYLDFFDSAVCVYFYTFICCEVGDIAFRSIPYVHFMLQNNSICAKSVDGADDLTLVIASLRELTGISISVNKILNTSIHTTYMYMHIYSTKNSKVHYIIFHISHIYVKVPKLNPYLMDIPKDAECPFHLHYFRYCPKVTEYKAIEKVNALTKPIEQFWYCFENHEILAFF